MPALIRASLRLAALLLLTAVAMACSMSALKPEGTQSCVKCVQLAPGYGFEVVAEGLDEPQSLDWLPDGRMLITERKGDVRVVDATGKLAREPWLQIPIVRAVGDRGLTGIAVDRAPPAGGIYLYYESLAEDAMQPPQRVLLRVTLQGDAPGRREAIEVSEGSAQDSQMGGLMRFGGLGDLFLAAGRDGVPDNVLGPDTPTGKLVRFDPATLRAPSAANAAVRRGPAFEVIAPQVSKPWGFALRQDGGVYFSDHGPYNNAFIYYAPPNLRPDLPRDPPRQVYGYNASQVQGLEFYSNPRVPELNGSVLLCATPDSGLHRVTLGPTGAEVMQDDLIYAGCSADVRTGPDGFVYFVDSGLGRVLRLRNGINTTTPGRPAPP